MIEEGSPEMRVLECVPEGSEGISKADLEAALGADLVKVRLPLHCVIHRPFPLLASSFLPKFRSYSFESTKSFMVLRCTYE